MSHDSTAAPSFLGFRNLMVIVLGMVAYLIAILAVAIYL